MTAHIFRIILDENAALYDRNHFAGCDHSLWALHLACRVGKKQETLPSGGCSLRDNIDGHVHLLVARSAARY